MKAVYNTLMWILSPTGPKTKAESKQVACSMKGLLGRLRESHATLEKDGRQVQSHPKASPPSLAPQRPQMGGNGFWQKTQWQQLRTKATTAQRKP